MIDDQPIPQHPRPVLTLTAIFIAAAGLLIALVLAAFAFIVGDFGKDVRDLEESSDASPLVETSDSTPHDILIKTGFITGSLSFPSEEIPADMKVCAVNQQSQTETCTTDHIETEEEPYGLSYRIEVPEGTYTVYAQLPDQAQKAFYSEFVTCGLSVDCPSHEPIPVEVAAGETVNNVDPHDWYVIDP
ncbi:MAG TPA: hypothetical protein VF209_00170 [Patescibacteria group bacterium]